MIHDPLKKQVLLSLLVILLLVNNSCRYKDNEIFSALSVKKRLNRTWILKKASSGEVDLLGRDPKMLNEELKIEVLKDEKLYLTTTVMRMGCVLKSKKTKIYPGSGIDPHNFHLTITKLTNKELWLEGNPILGLCLNTSVVSDYVKLEYHSK